MLSQPLCSDDLIKLRIATTLMPVKRIIISLKNQALVEPAIASHEQIRL
jgi:hypothetical protein